MKKQILFFTGLFLLVLILFKNAFSMHFFQDDFLFLKLAAEANSVSDFLNFYNPFRTYSYKPLASETFYFLLRIFGNNIIIGHLIVFITFFIGLIYLFKIINKITKDELWAYLSVFLYATHFIHVFQLYWFATYQEVLVFCLLTVSFYKYLNSKYNQAIFYFFLSLFCKETAVLYLVFLIFWEVFNFKKVNKEIVFNLFKKLFYYILLSGIFYYFYSYSLKFVTNHPNYQIHLTNIRLFINNCLWYFLWSVGFPNFLPDYLRTIFSKPIPEFWNIYNEPYVAIYLKMLILYLIFLLLGGIIFIFQNKKQIKKIFNILIFNLICFYIFLGPILYFLHKWMIRLTLPLIFLSIFNAYLILNLIKSKKYVNKIIAILIVLFYLTFNYLGLKVHEVSSLYTGENNVYKNVEKILYENKDKVEKSGVVYFSGASSERILNTLHGQKFLDHFMPGEKVKAIFEFQDPKKIKSYFIINSDKLVND